MKFQVVAVTQRDNLSGVILANRYEIGDLLGTGGFGSTYRARDLARFNAACAVKELLPARRDDATAKRLFEREARLLSQLAHRQIPTLQGYFAEENRYYLIQDFVAGQTLKERLQRQTRLGETEVLGIIIRVLDVLEYLHNRVPPVIHRDIKPANIILGEDGVVYIIDFGAVREVLSVEESATAIGTPGYTPREQAVGHARPASDLYALGATALEAISGLRPIEWHDRTTGSISFQGRLACSSQFERILSGLLADVPNRFATAAQVRAAIEEAFGEGAVSPQPSMARTPTPLASPALEESDVPGSPASTANAGVGSHSVRSEDAHTAAPEVAAADSRVGLSIGRKVLAATTAAFALVLVFLLGQLAVDNRAGPDNPTTANPTQVPAADTTSTKQPTIVDTNARVVDTAASNASALSAAVSVESSSARTTASKSAGTPAPKRSDSTKSGTEPTSAGTCALLNERLALGEALSNADREKLRKCR